MGHLGGRWACLCGVRVRALVWCESEGLLCDVKVWGLLCGVRVGALMWCEGRGSCVV